MDVLINLYVSNHMVHVKCIILFVNCASIKLEVSGRTASFQWGTLWEEEAVCKGFLGCTVGHRLRVGTEGQGSWGSRTPVLSVSLRHPDDCVKQKKTTEALNSSSFGGNKSLWSGRKVDRCGQIDEGRRDARWLSSLREPTHRRYICCRSYLPSPRDFLGLSWLPVCSRNRVPDHQSVFT